MNKRKRTLKSYIASDVAEAAIVHLKEMYPEQWAALGSSCRRSLRGVINNRTALHLDIIAKHLPVADTYLNEALSNA